MKELKVGEALKVAKGGVLIINTKSGKIINLPEKAALKVVEKNKNMEFYAEPCAEDEPPCDDDEPPVV